MAEDSNVKLRVLPHNDDAEKAFLGSILLKPEAMNDVESFIKTSDFYQKEHQVIYDAIIDIYNQGSKTLDIVVLTQYLKNKGLLEKAGGYAYVASLSSQDLIVSNIKNYADIIKDASRRRHLFKISSDMSLDSFDDTKDILTSLDVASQELTKLLLEEQGANISETFSLGKTLTEVYEDIVERANNPGGPTNKVKTGFNILDDYTNGGLNPADYVIVAARPSIGKTAMGISIMCNMLSFKKRVAFFSLETPAHNITKRMLAIKSKISSSNLEKAILNENEIQKLVDACSSLYEAGCFIIDVPNMSLSDIRAKSRSLHREEKLDCIIIDYIGLISYPSKRDMPNFEKVSEISKSLKNLARELNIPIIVLCQVNRDSEDKEPMLSNLRDSGSIEQDADLVCFLHRRRILTKEDFDKAPRTAIEKHPIIGCKLIVAKNRNGITESGTIGFIPPLTEFVNAEPDLFVPLSEADLQSKRR